MEDLEQQLRNARQAGQLQAAKSEVKDLNSCLVRQEAELDELRQALRKKQQSEASLRKELRRQRRRAERDKAQLQLTVSQGPVEPWHQQMQTLCTKGGAAALAELERAHQMRMQMDASREARAERAGIAATLSKAKQASSEAAALAQQKRDEWSRRRKDHIAKTEGLLADTRAGREPQ